jgi:hypothetical protein
MANANGTNPEKSPKFFTKLGILTGFIVEVVTTIFMKMTDAELQHWINKKEIIRNQLRTTFNFKDVFVEEKEVWRKFYQKNFFLDLNFSDVVIPEKPVEGTWRLLIIAQGLTMNQVYDSMSKAFKGWRYDNDLDKVIVKNTRDTKNAYAIWVRDSVEPDKRYLGKSTNQVDPDMTIGVTLLERMLHEVIFFGETGNHLDIKGATFCSGSRYVDGLVPCVYWGDSEVQVDRCSLDYSNSSYGVREAVSV